MLLDELQQELFPSRPPFMLAGDLSSILLENPSEFMLNDMSAEKEAELLNQALARQAEQQRAAKDEQAAAKQPQE